MTEYEKNSSVKVAYPPIAVETPLGKILSDNSITQLRITESEKERFVTFYFNGQVEEPFPLEDRLIIPSPKVPTYDFKPEMSSYELTQLVIQKIKENKHAFILVNFPNPDMVGHTGNIQATITAVKTVDNCVNQIVNQAILQNTTVIITGDHGNAEEKINVHTGGISTEHTDNQVPFIVISNAFQGRHVKLQSGILADIAPTILQLMGVSKPEIMTGRDLLEELK